MFSYLALLSTCRPVSRFRMSIQVRVGLPQLLRPRFGIQCTNLDTGCSFAFLKQWPANRVLRSLSLSDSFGRFPYSISLVKCSLQLTSKTVLRIQARSHIYDIGVQIELPWYDNWLPNSKPILDLDSLFSRNLSVGVELDINLNPWHSCYIWPV